MANNKKKIFVFDFNDNNVCAYLSTQWIVPMQSKCLVHRVSIEFLLISMNKWRDKMIEESMLNGICFFVFVHYCVSNILIPRFILFSFTASFVSIYVFCSFLLANHYDMASKLIVSSTSFNKSISFNWISIHMHCIHSFHISHFGYWFRRHCCHTEKKWKLSIHSSWLSHNAWLDAEYLMRTHATFCSFKTIFHCFIHFRCVLICIVFYSF